VLLKVIEQKAKGEPVSPPARRAARLDARPEAAPAG
jgi:hypothetical protein